MILICWLEQSSTWVGVYLTPPKGHLVYTPDLVIWQVKTQHVVHIVASRYKMCYNIWKFPNNLFFQKDFSNEGDESQMWCV
jgi:hypothetical protein